MNGFDLMITGEPKIKVALLQDVETAEINLDGDYLLGNGCILGENLTAEISGGYICLKNQSAGQITKQKEILLTGEKQSAFTLPRVKIGINFHWQQNQRQTFRGDILLSAVEKASLNLINIISLEDYLASVISSEMSAEAPPEFLKAQAVTARSWLVAMLEKKKAAKPPRKTKNENEIITWQDVNDHEGFDVCADDHCQRYQGITKIISDNVKTAIEETRGMFLVISDKICDARYYKCCGGLTEIFSTAWENILPPYLKSVTCDKISREPISSEKEAREWLNTNPPAYCNTQDNELMEKILPSFDRKISDFYRWKVIYTRRELEEIIKAKSGIDFGELQNIKPLARGHSGRIYKLKLEGSKKTITVGKELEIRRWLSP
ncbi:MAG TPA: SpoIID/LytB domain-containing protein, partial [Deltaproteobacteria bacterium]|nr:SpoIID/LytB domain-containing protein [Deltaproteobacteria bacterium]